MIAVRSMLALSGLAWAAPALAEEAPPLPVAAAADPETMAAALALFDGRDLEKQLLASALHMVQASLDAEMAALEERDAELPESLTAKLQALMFEETRAMVAEMAPTYRADAAAIYARYFTTEELKELKRLQAHPVMRKAETLGPKLMAELSGIGMRISAARMPEIQEKARALVEQWLEDETMTEETPST